MKKRICSSKDQQVDYQRTRHAPCPMRYAPILDGASLYHISL